MKLVVLDLNGVLVERVYIENRPPKADADMYVTNSYGSKWEIYFKKDVDKFLQYLFKNFDVGVWTCGRLENVKPITDKLFKDYTLAFLKTQEDCDLMRYEKKTPKFVKHVRKIEDYSPNDIMFIDDDFEKVRLNYPAGLITDVDFDNIEYLLEKWKIAGDNGSFQIPSDVTGNMYYHLHTSIAKRTIFATLLLALVLYINS